jgi:hypothetical protein
MGDQRLIDKLPYPNSTAENARITFTTAVNVIQAFLGILSEAVSQRGYTTADAIWQLIYQ